MINEGRVECVKEGKKERRESVRKQERVKQ